MLAFDWYEADDFGWLLLALEDLASESRRYAKEQYIETILESDRAKFFKDIVWHTLNPYINYRLRELPPLKEEDCNASFDCEGWVSCLVEMSSSRGVGNELAYRLSKACGDVIAVREITKRLLRKDLRCGVGLKTAQKFMEIPSHEVMLCDKNLKKFFRATKNRDREELCWSIKLDGVRCWAVVDFDAGVVNYLSRSGKPFDNFGKFDEELIMLAKEIQYRFPFKEEGLVIFDGEVISTDGDFQRCMTQMHRLNKVDPSIFEFNIFDVVIEDTKLRQRLGMIDVSYHGILNTKRHAWKNVFVLTHEWGDFSTPEGAEEINRMVTSEGEEGIVIKDGNSLYEFKRSNSWCKVKTFMDTDLRVVALEVGKGKYKNKLGAALVRRFHKGKYVTSKVGSGFTDEEREEYWRDTSKIVGKLIEIQYQGVTRDGRLRFPTFLRIREDKEEEN